MISKKNLLLFTMIFVSSVCLAAEKKIDDKKAPTCQVTKFSDGRTRVVTTVVAGSKIGVLNADVGSMTFDSKGNMVVADPSMFIDGKSMPINKK
jgi:hypothetical protein